MKDSPDILDAIHLQQYLYLCSVFTSGQIDALTFEKLFLQTRREDPYWMSGKFAHETEQVLNSLFFDIDDFAPAHLYDPADPRDIDEAELKKRTTEKLHVLQEMIKNV